MSHPLLQKFHIIPISLSQLLGNMEIFDQIVDGKPKISWKFSSGKIITNDNNTLLINRVTEFPSSLFSDFHPDDQKYAMTEFYAYLTFSLYSFPNKTAYPGSYGLAGNQFPLPYQWKKAKESGLLTPEFYLGAIQYCPYTEKNKNIVYTSIYNYYNWKPSQPQLDDKYIFCFECPNGHPYLLLTIGNQTSITPLSNAEVDINVSFLEEYARKISFIFNHSITETLIFINDNKITFGMTSIVPKRFSQNKNNIEMLIHFLNEASWS